MKSQLTNNKADYDNFIKWQAGIKLENLSNI